MRQKAVLIIAAGVLAGFVGYPTAEAQRDLLPEATGADVSNASLKLETGETRFLNTTEPRKDVIGDDLPPRALMRFGSNRFQHPSSVTEMRLSPDGQTVVTLDSSFLVAWDATTGQELWRAAWREYGNHIMGSAYGQRFIAFSSDNSKFYTTSSGNRVYVWETRHGKASRIELDVKKPMFQLFGMGTPVSLASIDVTADGAQLLVGGSSGGGLFEASGKRVWFIDNKPEKPLRIGEDRDRLSFGGDYSTAIFSPDEKFIALVMSQAPEQISLLESKSGEKIGDIPLSAKLTRMDFSPNGKFIYTTERDCGIRKYSVESRERTWELVLPPDDKGAESYTSAIDCSPDGKLLAVGAPIGSKYWIYLVDSQSGKETAILRSGMWKPWAVQFTSDSQTLFSNGWDGAVRRWDVASAKELPLPHGIRASSTITYSPDGKSIAFVDNEGMVRIVDARSGIESQRITPESTSGSVLRFSPDSQAMYVGGTSDEKVSIESWDLNGKTQAHKWQWPVGADAHSDIEDLATTKDGKYLAAAVFRQDTVYVWDAVSSNQVAKLKHNEVYDVDFSPDGRTIATVGWDEFLRTWASSTGKLISQVNVKDAFATDVDGGADRRMYGVRYSPNGKQVALVHMDGAISVWNASDPDDLQFSHHIDVGRRFTFGAIDYSPDGVFIAAGDGTGQVTLFDAHTGDRMLDVGKHEDHIYSIRFGGDSRRLVTGGGGVSYLWQLDGEQALEVRAAEDLWKELGSSAAGIPYPVILALSRSDSSLKYIVDRLQQIRTVLDPDALTRNLDGEAAKRRLALASKAAENDNTVEHLNTVHRALMALRLSQSNEAILELEWIVQQHQNETVRFLAGRLRECFELGAS